MDGYSLFALIFIVGLASFVAGMHIGDNCCKDKAADAGAGEYVCDKNTGEVRFYWLKTPQPESEASDDE